MKTCRLLGALLLAACATTRAPVEGDDPCDQRSPARIDLETVNRAIAEKLDFTRALAEEIEPCPHVPSPVMGPAAEHVARCRAQSKTPGCVWACAVAAFEQQARDDAEAVNDFVEKLPTLLQARPDCVPLASNAQLLLRCLGVSHPAIRWEHVTVRVIDGHLESVDVFVSLAVMNLRFTGRTESAACGTGTLWSTYDLR